LASDLVSKPHFSKSRSAGGRHGFWQCDYTHDLAIPAGDQSILKPWEGHVVWPPITGPDPVFAIDCRGSPKVGKSCDPLTVCCANALQMLPLFKASGALVIHGALHNMEV
jgi:hypothetical protein